MRKLITSLRIGMTIAAVGYATVFVISLAEGPRAPAIEAVAQEDAAAGTMALAGSAELKQAR